ncbi:MAG: adenylosuccinate lyase [Spirochaetaceae bacterium]|jgi:adenylosuccinate lyase|nr:adenylosuccinate lyase [Spirochaetaceae bacterium]
MSVNRPIFQNISPLDHRYSLSEKAVFEGLAAWLSEEAAVTACVKAEAALCLAHLRLRGLLSAGLRSDVEAAVQGIGADEIYAEEEKTQHHIRALVNVMKKKVPAEAAPFVHLGATSADMLDTSFAYCMKNAALTVVVPLLKKLENLLCAVAEREAETPQVGRTHGQHAVPITVGFAFAEYVSRLGKSIAEIVRRAGDLRGKLSGAVGAYNAMSMIVGDPEALEEAFLAEMGLLPSEHSTQLAEPEYLLRLLLEMNVAFGIIANLADDLRHLQRSEIGELREGFGSEQVGSSTMPQKRNPWNSEHVKSLWKAFSPRVATFFMDQISEHQRDLTNSASRRFTADYVTGFALAVSRMTGVVAGLDVDRERLAANLYASGGGIPGGVMAEPAYILLAESGESNAHEIIRQTTLQAEKEHCPFSVALKANKEAWRRVTAQMITLGLAANEEEAAAFFAHPEKYCGLSVKKARELAAKYRNNG